ncbi:hypothetical protein [Citricoccus sp. SGAir0253]|nr:hypothetical protein [Citricoccus sp. SGAir0253]
MQTTPEYPPAFAPKRWVLPPHSGTNGHITSWGAMLSGLPPARA